MDQQTSSLVDERSDARGALLELDAQPLKLCGWAACSGEPVTDDGLVLFLRVGSVLLGTIRRDRPRTEAAREAETEAPIVGFDVPDFGLLPFALMTGLSGLFITAEAGEDASARVSLDSSPHQSANCQPLSTRHKGFAGIRLADAWIEGSRN